MNLVIGFAPFILFTLLSRLSVDLALWVAFAAAGQGLLLRRRWGWALTLGAVFCSALYGMWVTVKFHQTAEIVMVALNLVFFLYLVRPEVRARLR